jgi:aryl-alcohol dehydrogenase-like predicted oxidoreductase
MRYRPLGDSRLMVSVAGLGCNNFGRRVDLAGTRAVVDAAIDAGITMLDTADIYGDGGASEELLGEVLAGRRDQVVLATKFGHAGYDMGYGRPQAPKAGAPTSGTPSSDPCAGSGPAISTCTSSIPPTR